MTNPVLAKSEAFTPGYTAPQFFGPIGQPSSTYDPNQPYSQGQPYTQAYGTQAPITGAPGYPGVQGGYPGVQAPYPGVQSPYPGVQSPYPGVQTPYPGVQGGYPGVQSPYPATPGAYPPPPSGQTPAPAPEQKVMTFDDVLTKTGITLGLTIVVAILSVGLCMMLDADLAILAGAGLVCGLATLIFPFIAATRRRVGPGIAIPFAILEGVFIGAISMMFELVYHGIVIQAVLATFVAAALTLIAFRFGKIRVSSKVRKVLMISMFAYVGVALVNLGLSFAGINLGLFPGPYGQVSIWAWVAAGIGVLLAVISLIDDFQYIEQGIRNKAPASESWRAAYGLTVTLVWLYVNLLRILSYIRR